MQVFSKNLRKSIDFGIGLAYNPYVRRKKKQIINSKTYAKGKKTMDKIKFCVVCGRRIPELSMRKKTCGILCARKKKSGYAPYINYDRPPYEDLTRLQQMAHKAGMSYGKFMAVKNEEVI